MLRQLSIILFLFIVLSCKEDSQMMPQASFVSLAGTWRLTAVEKGTFGQKYWENVTIKSSDNIIFRQDGAVLDADSLKICCGPTSLLINGSFREINPEIALAPNPICAVVNCVSCPTWEIEWKDDEIIISYCDGSRARYVRI